jgi:hypothetical protein
MRPAILFVTLSLATLLLGCANTNRTATNGRVSLTLPPAWTATNNPDGHISLTRHSLESNLTPWLPPPDFISIHSHPDCISPQQLQEIKQRVTRAVFGNKPPTSSWFEVKTQSEPLSCLANESLHSEDYPTDTMLCFSANGTALNYSGRAFVQPEAIDLLRSMKLVAACTPKNR